MFPVRQFRRAGAFRGTPLLVAASFCFLILATGSASSADGHGAASRPRSRPLVQADTCAAAPTGFASCDAQVVTNAAGSPLAASAPPASALGPAQFRVAYALPASAASSATIAIVDAYDDPERRGRSRRPSAAHFGLPACTTANGCFRKVNQNGGTSYPPRTPAGRSRSRSTSRSAHAICPSCKILLVEATPPRSPTSAPPRTRRSRSARTSSRTPGAARESSSETRVRHATSTTRASPITVVLRRRRLRRRVPGGLAVRRRRRRHVATLNADNSCGERDGLDRAGSRLLARTSPSRPGRPTPAARGARSPTSRPSPTPTPASRSTTRTATAAAGWFQFGGTSARRAARSPPSTPWRGNTARRLRRSPTPTRRRSTT